MNMLETPISHETEPHCCGCWNVFFGEKPGFLKLVCNECGEEVPLKILKIVKEETKEMRASKVIKALQYIIDTEGDLVVDISVVKQPKVDQQYLVAEARFVVVESYEDPKEKRISIRDWPY